jgi:adenylate cyclase
MILVIVFTTVGFWVTPFYTLMNCGFAVLIYFALGILVFHEQTAVVVVYTVNLTIAGVLSFIFVIQRERVFRENFLLNRSLDAEKREAERFLFQLVPAEAIAKIKRGEAVADTYVNASVVFCDLAGFTRMSEKQTPDRLILILNDLFNLLDEIAEEIGVEKVKTIGDSFMGIVKLLPGKGNGSSANVAIKFGLKAIEMAETSVRNQGLDIRMRVGINTGDVIGGVVGKTKFYYNYWGDSVNVASRMQSTGEPGRVHVAETTYKAALNEFWFEPRGQIEVRGKGRMNTFFVNGRREDSVCEERLEDASLPGRVSSEHSHSAASPG